MLKPYELLENVLIDIEKNIRDDIDTGKLSKKYALSEVHLRRLFNFAFKQTISGYMRSRRLAASLDDLLKTDSTILDIALHYGFEYEQSYIRAFKHEFGLTPGDLRKTGQIVKVKPPLHLFDTNRFGDGLIFGPDIVMVPQFHVVGKNHKVPFHENLFLTGYFVDNFNNNERALIQNTVNNNIITVINRGAAMDTDFAYFMPSVQVKTLDNIPEGFDHYTFPSSLCANFRFIGSIDTKFYMTVAGGLYKAINDFIDDKHQNYSLDRRGVNIDQFDISAYDGSFNQWEWYAPVIERTENDTPTVGIIDTYRQEMPALRFIGKKYSEPLNTSVFDKILDNLDNWCLNRTFEEIKKQSKKDPKAIYEEGDAYISLIRIIDNLYYEYWLGMFMPEKTKVPQGFEMIDFQKSTLGICSVYDKRNMVIHYDTDCREKLAKEDIRHSDETGTKWFFQRFNWHRFFGKDRYGKRILEYCYFI